MKEIKGGSLDSVKEVFLKNPFTIEGDLPEGDSVGKALLACFDKNPQLVTADFVLKFGFQLKLSGINWRHQDQIGIVIEWLRMNGFVRVFIEKGQIFVALT